MSPHSSMGYKRTKRKEKKKLYLLIYRSISLPVKL